MYTLEQKVDVILKFITTDDENELAELKRKAKEALEDTGDVESMYPRIPVYSKDDTIDEVIDNFLKDLGCPTNIKGHGALAFAINLCLRNPEHYKGNITKGLYVDVAKHLSSTKTRIERDIRYAIEEMFKDGNIENLYAVFGRTVRGDSGKLCNSEFIFTSVKEIKRRLKRVGIRM